MKTKIILTIIFVLMVGFTVGFIIGYKSERTELPQVEQEPIRDTLPAPVDTLSEWQTLQLAIIMAESKGDPNARGKDGDYGLYQMLPCYVSEVNRVSGSCYFHKDAFDADKAIDMFNRLQGYYNKERDIDKAIYYHNKASHYRKTIYNTMKIVERYEIARRKIIEYGN